jgi:pimeloyl-ACP methyl ester carboxylesterase
MDVYLSAAPQKAPLVVFLHGYDSSKAAHSKQAEHVASWGMHGVSVQLPNTGPWETNGRTLARLVAALARTPDAIDRRVDAGRIILVGHSFGAYSVAVALAESASARGGILLDPATLGRDAVRFLRRIRKPVMVVGADEDVAPARNRAYFFEFIRSGVGEVSIRGAVHEDAQYPSDAALENGGVDPDTTEAHQVTFAAAVTVAALSLSATGALGPAWASFQPALKAGRLFNPKRK